MRVMLKDPEGDGSVEVWTRDLETNVRLTFINSENMAPMVEDCTFDGASEPDYVVLAREVADLLMEERLGTQQPNHMRSCVYRFIAPGPGNTDDDVTWEA